MNSDTFSWITFLLSGSLSLLIGWVFSRFRTAPPTAIFLVLLQISLFIFSGAAVAYGDTPINYAGYHYAFLISFLISFHICYYLLRGFGGHVARSINPYLNSLRIGHGWNYIIGCYLILCIFDLIYPENRLAKLFQPEAPDLRSHFQERMTGEETSTLLGTLVYYLRLLLLPFYFVALSRLRNRLPLLLVLVAVPLYINYTSQAYIARGTIMISVLVFCLYSWIYRPDRRKLITVLSLVMTPFIFVFLHAWQVIRLGNQYHFSGIISAVEELIIMETSFPRDVGMFVINTNVHADLASYAKWVFTLPVPKFIIGNVQGARINYEIAEHFLGVGREVKGYYVVLGGVVAESVYIFGKKWFFLHAITMGFLASLFSHLTDKLEVLGYLSCMIIVYSAYKIPASGISGYLPYILNGNISFIIFVIICLFRYSPQANFSCMSRRIGRS